MNVEKKMIKRNQILNSKYIVLFVSFFFFFFLERGFFFFFLWASDIESYFCCTTHTVESSAHLNIIVSCLMYSNKNLWEIMKNLKLKKLACIATFWMKRKRELPYKTFFSTKGLMQHWLFYFILTY